MPTISWAASTSSTAVPRFISAKTHDARDCRSPLGPCSRGLRRDKPRFANRAKVLRTGLVILRHAIDEHRVRDVVRGAGVSQKLLGEINAPAPIPEMMVRIDDSAPRIDSRFWVGSFAPLVSRHQPTSGTCTRTGPGLTPALGCVCSLWGLPTATPEGAIRTERRRNDAT